MKITSKGQVTIPIEIRARFGFLPDSDVEFVVEGGKVYLVRSASRQRGRGAGVVRRLRGTGSGRMSTDEILRLTRA